jgi:protein AATF/BFR2
MPSTRSSNRAGGGLNLAALANPAPASTELPDDDFDPTGGALPRDASADSGDDDSGDGFSDDDVGAVDDGVLAPTEDDKGDKGGRLRMRGGLSLDELGAEYHGKRTSRKAMEEAWAGAEDPDAEEDSEDDDEEEDEDDSMEGLDADDLARMEREAAEDDDGSDEDDEDIDDEDSDEDDDDDSGADVDVDDDDDESQEASDDDDDDDGGDGGDLAAELAAFRREEAEANRLAAAKSQNAVKGAAVRRQNEVWEKALQTRIVLQRGLNASAKMPTPTYWRALAKADGEVKPAMATCAAAARGALDALCSLQAALIDGNPAIAEAAGEGVGGGKKRKASSAMAAVSKFGLLASPASEVWENIDSVYQRFAAFRDVSIDRWHRKAQVQVGKMSAGGGAGGGGEMRAFNQSVSAQVASAMRIPDRLVRKSQPPAHLAPKRLGEPEGTEKAAPTGDRTEDIDADDLEAAARAEARVEEIYDDADFYEQVLKEFLESAGAAAGLAAAASKPAKRRKVVDRRASKGRKLRYHVQQKLVNFCAPVELEVPQWAEKIFGQLFASSA